MGFYGKWRMGAAAVGLLAAGAAPVQAKSQDVAVLPDTYGSVVIGDIPGLLDRAGALAAEIVPGMKPDQLKQQFGSMLGDPQLSGLPAGSGVAVVMPRQGQPFAFLEVSAEKRTQWRQLLQQRGMGTVGEAEGLLILAPGSDALKAAQSQASRAKSQLLEGSGSPTLAATVRLADLLQKYEPQIQSGMESFTQRARESSGTTTETAAQLQGAATMMRVYMALGRRVETLSASFEPSAEGFTMNWSVVPKAGEGATKGTAPVAAPEGRTGSDLLQLLPGSGAMRGQMDLDPSSMIETMLLTMDEVAKATGEPAEGDQKFRDWMEGFARTWTGAAAMTFMPTPEAPMSGAYAIGVKDEASAVQFLADSPVKFEGSSMGRLYEQMGMRLGMSFQKNVREYQGVPIHRLKMSAEFTSSTPAQHQRMAEIMNNLNYDAAVVNNVLVYGVEPYKVEQLIDAVKAGKNPEAKPLVSKQELPGGGHMYLDYNLGQIWSAMASMGAPDGPGGEALKKMAAGVQDAPPLLVGGYSDGPSLRLTVRVPVGMIRTFVQAAQQSQSTPGSTDGGTEPGKEPGTEPGPDASGTTEPAVGSSSSSGTP